MAWNASGATGEDDSPSSLAYLKRSIAETKREEANAWGWHQSRPQGYHYSWKENERLHPGQREQAARLEFLPVKTGRADGAATRPSRGSYLFKDCPQRDRQQKILWAEVRRDSGRDKYRFMIREVSMDERCSWAVLDFLSTTDVGRRVPDSAEEDL